MSLRFFPLLVLLGCQEPFRTDRHDLREFRIASLGVHDGVAAAAVWSGIGPWHDVSPVLSWTLDGQTIGEGFDVVVPGTGRLGLTATAADGQQRQAEVDVVSVIPSLSVSRFAVDVGEDLSLAARRSLEETPVVAAVSSGQSTRMRLEGLTAGSTARWMSAVGTVLELENDTADLLAEEILFDDGEIETRTPLDDGLFVGLALVVNGAGENDWLWVDAAVGIDDATLLRHQGRLIPTADATEAGLIAATLVEDEVAGVRLVDTEAVLDTAQQTPLSCMPAGADVFLLSWVAEGRCPRPDVVGARVVVEAW